MIELEKWPSRSLDDIVLCTIYNKNGNYVSITNYGCAIVKIFIPGRDGIQRDVVLGYDTADEYIRGKCFFGACVGRFGGYIENGHITVNGRDFDLPLTDGKNHLHGGIEGFDKKVWNCRTEKDKAVFYRKSIDGEEGYPGNLEVSVSYEFTDEDILRIRYEAKSDSDTVCNLTNHSYFNLNGAGSGDIKGHELTIFADLLDQNNEDGISCPGLIEITGTPFDFRSGHPIGDNLDVEDLQMRYGHGYDHNYLLRKKGMKTAAILIGERSGIRMEVRTTHSGLQLYTGNYIESENGKEGIVYRKNDGVCLETQYCATEEEVAAGEFYPILHAGERYEYLTEIMFGIQA